MSEGIDLGNIDDDPANWDWLRNLNKAAAEEGISTVGETAGQEDEE